MDGRLARIAGPVDRVVHAKGVPGAGIAVLAGGEVAVEHYAGDAGPGIPAGPETLWPIASISKLYTATMIMHLAEMPISPLSDWSTSDRPCDPGHVAGQAVLLDQPLPDSPYQGGVPDGFEGPP